jgi:dihydropteroate synthase
MGVVNTTPDSFSDGGFFADYGAAVAHGRGLVADGADIVDVGGESTRPGAEPVGLEQEIERTIPVVSALVADGLIVSIDTMKPEVADAALEAGAQIVNDVGGMRDPEMRRVAAERGAGVVVVHMQGEPRTMQDNPVYDDVVGDIARFFGDRCSGLIEAGVDPDAIVVDPGLGFGKTVEHNLVLLNRISELSTVGRPVMVGASRKRFLGTLTGRTRPAERDLASAVAAALAIERGAAVIRVHDVAMTIEAARVAWAIVREDGASWVPVDVEGAATG